MHPRRCYFFFFLYEDMEQLAVPHGLLWVLYANAKTFRIVRATAKLLLRFSHWSMLFRESFKVSFFLLFSAVISPWNGIIEPSGTTRRVQLVPALALSGRYTINTRLTAYNIRPLLSLLLSLLFYDVVTVTIRFRDYLRSILVTIRTVLV